MKSRILTGLSLLSALIIFLSTFLLLISYNLEKTLFTSFAAGVLAGIPATLLSLHCIREVRRHTKTKAEKTPYDDINLMDTKFEKCG